MRWLALLGAVVADEATHSYADGERMEIWFDKLGPYNNPQENYPYSSASLCEFEEDGEAGTIYNSGSMGEALEGHQLVASPKIPLAFREERTDVSICDLEVTEELKKSLEAQISELYWYSFYVDDLPTWAFLGEQAALVSPEAVFPDDPDKERKGQLKRIKEAAKNAKGLPVVYKLFTHRTFVVYATDAQVIAVDVVPTDAEELVAGQTITLTYSVVWKEPQQGQTFENRFDRYLETNFFEHKVHWFAILNSCILALFLCLVVFLILMKTLKKDFNKFSVEDVDEVGDLQSMDDSGFKVVHGDVFRPPPNALLLSVLYANGCHVVAICLLALMIAICSSLYLQRGGIRGAIILVYMFTNALNGYQGGSLYRRFGGKLWKPAMVLQAGFIPGLLCCVFAVVNSVAWANGSVHAVSALRIVQGLGLYIFTAVPLHVAGTVAGRRAALGYSPPVRVHHLKRPIPRTHCLVYPGLFLLGGFVPFGCMFIEMYYLFSAFWSYQKVYYVYGFLLAVLAVVSIVIVCVSITSVYVILNAEDYRWHWLAFLCTSTTGFYVFLYSCVYWHGTSMSGMLQWCYYFGSTFLFSVAVAIYAGALGYTAASWFVHLIYSNIKAE